jgi:integrase
MLNYAKRTHRIDRVFLEMLVPVRALERERILSTREIRRFIEAAHDLGGARRRLPMPPSTDQTSNEAAQMEWKEVDQEKWIWRLPAERSKNGKSQEIVLPPGVTAILESARSAVGGTEFLSGNP